MPKNIKALSAFPASLIGKFYYSDSILNVKNENYLYNIKYYSELYLEKDSIDLIGADLIISDHQIIFSLLIKSYYDLTKVDTTNLIGKHSKAKKSFLEKYIVFEEANSDTLFNINKGDQLKLYDGNYYLNHLTKKNDWVIYQFKISDNSFSINLTNNQDEEALINKTKSHTLFYTIKHLTNKEFKTFIAEGGFREKFTLKKYTPVID